MGKPKSVDDYLDQQSLWQVELRRLATILRSTGLDEAIKWGVPVFSYKGKNLVGLSGFQAYFGLWFYQGALLKDPHGVLINAQEGKTRALRQWRMSSAREIKSTWIKKLVAEAIQLQDSGQEIKPRRSRPLVIPPELESALRQDSVAETSFAALSPGCQREYADHIAEAKRAETRQRRLAKILPMIKRQQGLNDRYR